MRVFAGIAATAILIAACGGTAAVSTPTPTASPTASPTPTPAPTVANVFKAELKSSNEVPPITGPEATCTGNATVTFTATTAKFDVVISGCPSTTAINIGHIHEQVAGQNGAVKISTGLVAGDLTLTNGGVTFTRTATADAALISTIMANPAGYYVNFHSTAFPAGVIRGQLTKA
jgi:CHRD domain-containing protein